MEQMILQTNHITKSYRHFKALDDVSITLEAGHIYGFIGENGAGKTTLMRILTGLSFPTAGAYSLFGRTDEKELRALRRRVGSTIEEPALYPEFSAYRNLELQRILLGNPDKEASSRLLKLVDLYDVKNKRVREFSTGMKQRLGLALGLIYGGYTFGYKQLHAALTSSVIFTYVVSDTSFVFLMSIAAAVFIGKDFSNRTICNEIKLGYSRFHILLSRTAAVCALAALKAAIADISHDMKTPLTSVIGYSQLENPDQPVFAAADPYLLGRVVQNLISNGVKYTSGDLFFCVGRETERVIITVSNPVDCFVDAAHIFDRFYTQDKRGGGIGLYLCRQLTEAMGGSIRAGQEGKRLVVKVALRPG